MTESDDSGFTLMEMLVGMILMVLLGAAMTTTMSSIARGDAVTTSRVRATEQSQAVLDRLTKDIRAAAVPVTGSSTAVGYADVTHLTLYDDFTDGNGPRRIDITVTGGPQNAVLAEDITPADANGGFTATPQHRIDTTDLNVSSGALFSYYDAGGDVLTTPMSTTDTLGRIASIGISLVTQEPGLSTPVTVTTRVYLRNVQYH